MAKETLSSWRSYFELLRLPAVFTAIADVMMGFLVTFGTLHPGAPFVMLSAASAFLYLAGMVLNDVFDANIDASERPQRPIPSQRVSFAQATVLGWGLLALGCLTAAHLGYHGGSSRTIVVAIALAGCIVLYDAGAKHTLLGPLVMGACRTLNVLLGMSLATADGGISPRPWVTPELMLAGGMGLYIVGVTFFARGEASISNRNSLTAGIAFILAGISLIAGSAWAGNPGADVARSMDKLGKPQWFVLWVLLAAVIVRRCLLARKSRSPEFVQQAVRTCLRSIIVIDAAIVLGYCGAFWGCVVLALLIPTMALERWASTT